MSRLVLGIDAGQTATTAVVVTEDAHIVSVGVAGPIRHHAEHDAESALTEAFSTALQTAIPAGERIDVACLSLTGSAALASAVLERRGDIGRIDVLESDAFAALASGVGAHGGIAVIAGTGSVALARSAVADRHVLVGGWGWLMGDQGGGFAIGSAGLRAAARAEDGTGPPTMLGERLCEALGAANLRSVYNEFTGRGFDRPAIGQLARVVTRASQERDQVATAIVEKAAEYLAALVFSVARGAPYLAESEHVVVCAGGVLESGPVLDRLRAHLHRQLPDFRLAPPIGPPVIGAAMLGLARLTLREISDIPDKLRRQLDDWPELRSKTSTPPQDLEGTTR